MQMNYNQDEEMFPNNPPNLGVVSNLKGQFTSPFGFSKEFAGVRWMNFDEGELTNAEIFNKPMEVKQKHNIHRCR